jgi:hypothetical protein
VKPLCQRLNVSFVFSDPDQKIQKEKKKMNKLMENQRLNELQ